MTIVKLISLLFICGNLYATDIVQVDTGNSKDFRGVLNMDKTTVVGVPDHGTDMAYALEDELIKQRSKPVYAKQLVWSLLIPSSVMKALKKALDEKPKVLSLSFGGETGSPLEESILALHSLNDTVIVAAAGNDFGKTKYYPANYKNKCLLSVGTSINGRKISYSNIAKVWVEYNPKDPTGTSASTARMAAIVLQIRRQNPKMDCEHITTLTQALYGKIKND